MAKNSKKSRETVIPGSKPAPPISETRNGNGAAQSEEPIVAKSAAAKTKKATGSLKPAGGGRGASPRKASTTRKPKKKAGAGEVVVSDEEIRIRAYFISEQRMQNGVPGVSTHDWLEARRQLQEEAGQRA